jgi:hypothetical protein
MILPDLLQLAGRDDLTQQEKIALGLAIAMLDGEAPFSIQLDRKTLLLPHKIELIDGRLILT